MVHFIVVIFNVFKPPHLAIFWTSPDSLGAFIFKPIRLHQVKGTSALHGVQSQLRSNSESNIQQQTGHTFWAFSRLKNFMKHEDMLIGAIRKQLIEKQWSK